MPATPGAGDGSGLGRRPPIRPLAPAPRLHGWIAVWRRSSLAVVAAVLSLPGDATGQPIPELASVGPPEDGAGASWIVVRGPRTRQWLAPGEDGPHLTVEIALPEMALGSAHVETFRWERRDVLAEAGEGGNQTTRYQVLGVRHLREGHRVGAFIGAHMMSWAGQPSLVTPWFGMRLGEAAGPSVRLDARLAGLGVLGARGDSPLTGASFSLVTAAPQLGRWQVQARGRWCDRGTATGAGHEALLTVGVELERGRGRLRQPMFLGVGLRDGGEAGGSALLVHLDVTAPLPRGITRAASRD
jgi:hypothetical protein